MAAYLLDVLDGWGKGEKRGALQEAAWAWCEGAVGVFLSRVPHEARDIQEALVRAVGKCMMLAEFDIRRGLTAGDSDNQQRLIWRLIDAGADPNGQDRGNP